MNQAPRIAILMGSANDQEVMQSAADVLTQFEIPHTFQVLSAHRNPDETIQFAAQAKAAGYEVLIAGAGAAAALPGLLAAKTSLPVLGVPIAATSLGGLDALLSMVQMPGGVPVATMAIGKAGAKNAAFFALRILALSDAALAKKLGA